MNPYQEIMKTTLFVMVMLAMLSFQTFSHFSTNAVRDSEVTVMTFNIRHGDAPDGDNHWNQRREMLFDVIQRTAPDIVGVQEAMHFQLEEITSALPEYSWLGEGRDGGTSGEYSAILFRHKRFRVIESGTFWLSDTPEKPSVTWGNACVRICSWALFHDTDSGESLSVFNTHLDHVSQHSREQGVRLILRKIMKRPFKAPVILCGDFNAGETNPAVLLLTGNAGDNPFLLRDSFRVLHPDEKKVGTFNGFGIEPSDGEKIDYIFVDGNATVLDARIIRTERNGRTPSDHFPVTAHLLFSKAKK